MTSRERVIRAIRFEHPDRVPIVYRSFPGVARRHGRRFEELLLEEFPSDVLLSPGTIVPWFAFSDRAYDPRSQVTEDIWGCRWRRMSDDDQDAGMIVSTPLADLERLGEYSFPDPLSGIEGVELARQAIGDDGHRHYVLGAIGMLWQRLNFLRGFANSLLDTVERSEAFLDLRDRIVAHLLARIPCWQEVGADGVLLWDDWGTQRELMIDPQVWRDLFKESYRRIVDAIHAAGMFAHVHTDGNTTAIIGDLIEVGFDDINPQMSCMAAGPLGREYAGEVCFRPDLDRQQVLPHGTPRDVAAHIRQMYEALGAPAGGYISYGAVGPDVPLENVEAMARAFASLS